MVPAPPITNTFLQLMRLFSSKLYFSKSFFNKLSSRLVTDVEIKLSRLKFDIIGKFYRFEFINHAKSVFIELNTRNKLKVF